MGLDSLSDIGGDFDSGSEKTREDSEKTQEKKDGHSKGLAGIKRVQKDEKKAKKDNDFLFNILIEILKDSTYDVLIPFIVDLLEVGIPSNFIIGSISLINEQSMLIIRQNYGKYNEKTLIIKEKSNTLKYIKTTEFIKFNEDSLDQNLKQRINEWIEDLFVVISFDPSTVASNKFLHFYKEDKIKMVNLLVSVLTFFLYEQNIIIDKHTAFLYCEFILGEVKKKVSELKLEEI